MASIQVLGMFLFTVCHDFAAVDYLPVVGSRFLLFCATFNFVTTSDLIFLHLNDITGDLNPFFCERIDEIDTFRSDCFGDTPEVLCDCCSDCCDDATLLCTVQ